VYDFLFYTSGPITTITEVPHMRSASAGSAAAGPVNDVWSQMEKIVAEIRQS